MGNIRLTIDDMEIEAGEDATVLDAARDAGIYIPALCADPDLKPYGACRLCIVEIDKQEDLPASCMTPVADGMVVRTDTQRVNDVRRQVVELLLSDHAQECLVCPKNQRCELQKVAAYLGICQQRFKPLKRPPVEDSSNPFFTRDSSKCILCGKCVRVCAEVQGRQALEVSHNGVHSRIITTGGDMPIIESRCESCGQCVAKCPTAAIVPKRFDWPAKEIRTTCPYCGVGCGLVLAVRGNTVVGVRGDADNTINRGNHCVKGRFGYEFINHPSRLTTPLIRRNGRLTDAGWEEALDLIVDRLGKYKPHEIGVMPSARSTNEDVYVAQKFARAVLGTNNIDHCARL
jgi:predicted molibdopterin-dependent oxidoreductase YjgC